VSFLAFHRKQDPISGSISPALGVTTEGMGVMTESTVRRLTPTECERLQGFPDGWTSERFDEKKQAVIAQADSNRYKQMGNAVAVPVVDWIIKRLVAAQ
jgi:DNA (cytosine-5)-methyltransferase 1